MVRDNLGPGDILDNDKFSRALLANRNTPDRDTNKAQVLFRRQEKDFIPIHVGKYQPRPYKEWLLTQDKRERALRKRPSVSVAWSIFAISRAPTVLVPTPGLSGSSLVLAISGLWSGAVRNFRWRVIIATVLLWVERWVGVKYRPPASLFSPSTQPSPIEQPNLVATILVQTLLPRSFLARCRLYRTI